MAAVTLRNIPMHPALIRKGPMSASAMIITWKRKAFASILMNAKKTQQFVGTTLPVIILQAHISASATLDTRTRMAFASI